MLIFIVLWASYQRLMNNISNLNDIPYCAILFPLAVDSLLHEGCLEAHNFYSIYNIDTTQLIPVALIN